MSERTTSTSPDLSFANAPDPRDRQALVSKVGWSALASLTTVASRFVGGVIVARVLGPEHTGKLLYLLWVADFMAIVATFALPSVASRFLADLEGQNRDADAEAVSGWLYRWYVGMAAIGSIVVASIALRLTAGAEARSVSWCLGLYFFTLALHNYYLAHLAGRQQFRTSARISAMSSTALLCGVTVGAPMWGIVGAILGYLVSSLPGALLSMRCLPPLGQRVSIPKQLRSRLITYAAYTWSGSILSALTWSRGELFFIERYAGDFWVAMFAIGISLSALATQGPMLLTGALLPHFAQLTGAGRLDTLRGRYATAVRVLSLMLFPLCLGLSSLIPVLLPLVYGPDFAASVPTAMVLVAFSSLAFTSVSTAVVYALERASFIAIVGLFGAAAAIFAGFLVIPFTGIWGAAWSRAAIQTAMVAAGAIYLSRYHGCRFPVRDVASILTGSLACAGCSAAIVWTVGHSAGILVAVPVGAVVYVIVVRALRVIKPQDLALLAEVINRLPGSMVPAAVALVDYLAGGSFHRQGPSASRPHPARL